MDQLVSTFAASSSFRSGSGSSGSDLDFISTYGYDNLDRLTSILQQSQTGGHTVANKYVTFDYNALSQFTDLKRYANTSATNLVAQTDFTYDNIEGGRKRGHSIY